MRSDVVNCVRDEPMTSQRMRTATCSIPRAMDAFVSECFVKTDKLGNGTGARHAEKMRHEMREGGQRPQLVGVTSMKRMRL